MIVSPCPRKCGNFTYPRKRRHVMLSPADVEEITRFNAAQEMLTDGTCCGCWNKMHGYGRTKDTPRHKKNNPALYQHTMTESEYEVVRGRIKDYWRDRRTRGIPEDGLPPSVLGNGGLFCVDVA